MNWDNLSPKQQQERASRNNKNYTFEPPCEAHKNANGRWRYPAWAQAPAVNRKAVKICRMDYVGHSDGWGMFLEYGWSNKKGELPDRGLELTYKEFNECLSKDVLTPDARATLWGCNLGATEEQPDGTMSGLGPHLAKNYFGGGVVAADTTIAFDHITDNRSNMPIHIGGKPWVFYAH